MLNGKKVAWRVIMMVILLTARTAEEVKIEGF